MFNVKRAAVTALAGGALTLSGLGAGPAFAGGYGDYGDHDSHGGHGHYGHHYDAKPAVDVYVHGHKVKVTYECDTKGRGHDKYGVLKVSFKREHHKKWVKCDGDEHSIWYKVHGKGTFHASIKDPDGDRAYDSAYVRGHKGGHHHYH
jgi:hypothetical protein